MVFLEQKRKSLSPQPCFPRCLTNQISIKKSQKVKLLDRKSIKKKMMDEGGIIQWYDQSLKWKSSVSKLLYKWKRNQLRTTKTQWAYV